MECMARLVKGVLLAYYAKEQELNKACPPERSEGSPEGPPIPSAGLKPSAKRMKLFRNEVQEAEMAEYLFSPNG